MRTNGIIFPKKLIMDPVLNEMLGPQQREHARIAQENLYAKIAAKQAHEIQYQPVLDQIINRGAVVKGAYAGDKFIHKTGTKDLNISNVENILINKSPENINDLKKSANKLEELDLQIFDTSDTVINARQIWAENIKKQEIINPGTAIKKIDNEMTKIYDLNSETIQNLITDFASELGPKSYQTIIEYLQITTQVINPSISSAMVTIYFSMKTGPGPMIKMYYTLSFKITMHDFLDKISNEILKNNTPKFQINKKINQSTSWQINQWTNWQLNRLTNWQLPSGTEITNYFKENNNKITKIGVGASLATIVIAGIKYKFCTQTVVEPDILLETFRIVKRYVCIYAFETGDFIGSAAREFKSGLLNGWIESIAKDAEKIIEYYLKYKTKLEK